MAETEQGEELILYEGQIPHFNRVCEILKRDFVYIDTSVMGAGKSYIALAVAKHFNLSLAVVCIATMVDTWTELIELYDVPFSGVISYDSLTGKKDKPLNHSFLTRTDTRTDGGLVKTQYEATPQFKQAVSNGLLLVIDESQQIKNPVLRTKACAALCAHIMEAGTTSRFALLSATPFDKVEHVITLVKLLGIVQHEKMYETDRESGIPYALGLADLIEYCNRLDEKTTATIVQKHTLTDRGVKSCAFELYTTVVKTKLVSDMPPPSMGFKKDAKNGYYKLDEANAELLMKGIGQLAKAVGYRDDKATVEGKASMEGISKALGIIEQAKVPIFARLARQDLTTIPNCKVVLAVNRIESINYLLTALKDFNPLWFSGEVAPKKRSPIVNAFQHNPQCRLLIFTAATGGAGISLHDIYGGQQRRLYILPDHSVQTGHQTSGRIYRVGLKSDAFVRFVYGKVGQKETSILNAHTRKTNVLKAVIGEETRKQVLFPGDYPIEEEA